jgi:hypothetical protein
MPQQKEVNHGAKGATRISTNVIPKIDFPSTSHETSTNALILDDMAKPVSAFHLHTIY